VPQLIISISGIRGIVGDGLDPPVAVRFGLAFGSYLGGGSVVVGRDSRPSGPMLMAAVQAGLMATGCRVLDAGILSTPGTSLMVRDEGAAGGVIITASHNPSPYNGLKMLSPEGMQVGPVVGADVLRRYEQSDFTERGTDGVGTVDTVLDAAERHAQRVAGLVDADAIRRRNLSVVVDPANGAGGAEMRDLLARLGCRATFIHAEPTGRFGRGPEPVPENLVDLGAAVRDAGADLGLALDPDADRLALVDADGQPLGEEYTLALAVQHRLTQEPGPVAVNLSTSRLMDDVTREAGVPLIRTPVGEWNVAQAMTANRCIIGGEGNGGVIDPRVAPVRNSLAGAALILERMADTTLSLRELADRLPVYTSVKDKVLLGEVDAVNVIARVRERFPDAKVDDRDGLHLSWDEGWLHVRPSNTEPILRILAESEDGARARAWVEAVKALATASE